MRLTIDRFEGDRVVLRTPAGQELVVPRGEIPAHASVNDVLTISFRTDAEPLDQRAQRAKDVLNEILGGAEDEHTNGHGSTKDRNNRDTGVHS